MGHQLELATSSEYKLNRIWTRAIALCLLAVTFASLSRVLYKPTPPINANEVLAHCAHLHARPGVPVDFHERDVSDRFEEGTASTLIRNATIWTGGRDGTEVVYGDLLLDKGIIKAVGYIPRSLIETAQASDSLNELNADRAWITPGIFDLHSHTGLLSSPNLRGIELSFASGVC